MADSWGELIKAGGPAIGGLMLFAWGAFTGQYAAKFKPPFDEFASGICIFLMAAGFFIAVIQTILSAYKSHLNTNAKAIQTDNPQST